MHFGNFTDTKSISQDFLGFRKYRLVGGIATFERQIYLPKNSRNSKDGSIVISLQYLQFMDDC
jgi:hypothetical protein